MSTSHPVSSVTIAAGVVFTGDEAGTVFAPGEVSWTGPTLSYIGPPRIPGPGRRIELPQGAVLPGLVNGHNHAAMALLRGYADDSRLMPWLHEYIWPVEARMTAEDVYVGTLLASAEMIRSGTVGFADMYMFPEAIARAVHESGLRGFVARGLVGHGAEAQEALQQSVELARTWPRRYPLVEGWLGPHAPYTCSPSFLEQVAAAAQLHGLGIHIHLSESREEIAEMHRQHGLTPIQLAEQVGILTPKTLVAHGVYLTDQDRAILGRHQTGVVHCPVSNLKLGNGIAPITELMADGIRVGLGTDGPASTNTLDMFTEMRTAAWLQKSQSENPAAFSAQAALSLATRGSAAILGYDGGILRQGRPADVVAVNWWTPHAIPHPDPFSTLVYSTQAADVRYTVVAGRILLDDGVITSFDEEACMQEAHHRAQALIGAPR